MKKWTDRLLVVVFIILILGGFSTYLICNPRSYSENENRYLEDRVSFNWESLKTGDFTRQVESYMDDQFIFRDRSMALKSKIQKTLGNKDINKVYLAQDKELMERILEEDLDYNNLEKNTRVLADFFYDHRDKDISVIIAPLVGNIREERIPKYGRIFSYRKAMNLVRKDLDAYIIDVFDKLKEKSNQYIYYKTDHHWTSLGAFYAYERMAEENDWDRDIDRDYNRKTVSESFKGSLDSKVLLDDISLDRIDIYERKDLSYKLYYEEDDNCMDSIFDLSKLDQKDKYQIFLSGNHGQVRISTDNKNNKNLLILKDSYANSLIQFLIGEYENIYMVDLRHFNKNIDSYIKENDIDSILVLYNIKNFSQDKNIQKLNLR